MIRWGPEWLNGIEGLTEEISTRAAQVGAPCLTRAFYTQWRADHLIYITEEGDPLYNWNRVKANVTAVVEGLRLDRETPGQFERTSRLFCEPLTDGMMIQMEEALAAGLERVMALENQRYNVRNRAGQVRAGNMGGLGNG